MPTPRAPFFAGVLIVLAAIVVYAGTFSAPFVFDAAPIVTRYPSIRHLWPLQAALSPPHDGSTIEGRPLVNLSLAISYAMSGTRPWAYHAMNLAIHILAGLALFGIARRTLGGGGIPAGAEEARALGLALVIALLWTLHPLQTESVTYVIQRAESLMGLFYLLTLYAFIRAVGPRFPAGSRDRPAAMGWLGLAWVACLCGMASKEVMVSAPILVFLYDRAFVAGSWRAAWQRRRGFYGALALTWILLGWLAAGTGSRSGTAGLGAALPWSAYASTQIYAVVHYLRLALWPRPLVFDYGTVVATGFATLAWPGGVLAVLLAGTIFGLWRNRALGFLGAGFFAVLAPTSLVPIATQTMAEHRMYLPLAAVMTALVLGLAWAGERSFGRRTRGSAAVLAAGLVLTGAFGAMTVRRNALYGSEVALWTDSVIHWPGNARAHIQLGDALYRSGKIPEAAREFEFSLILQPANALAHYDLGNCFLDEGRPGAAAGQLAEAVRLEPENSDARNNFGNALRALRRLDEAIAQYQAALSVDPANAKAHFNLGNARVQQGDLRAAAAEYEAALRLDPGNAVAHFDLGNARARSGDMRGAIAHYEAALRLQPAYAQAQDNLGNAFFQEARFTDALGHYEAALRLAPKEARLHYNRANALVRLARPAEAADEYAEALRLQPNFREARAMLDHLRPPPAGTR